MPAKRGRTIASFGQAFTPIGVIGAAPVEEEIESAWVRRRQEWLLLMREAAYRDMLLREDEEILVLL